MSGNRQGVGNHWLSTPKNQGDESRKWEPPHPTEPGMPFWRGDRSGKKQKFPPPAMGRPGEREGEPGVGVPAAKQRNREKQRNTDDRMERFGDKKERFESSRQTHKKNKKPGGESQGEKVKP